MKKTYMWCGIILYCILVMPPVLKYLESSMIGQMIVLIPCLVLSGYFVGRFLYNKIPEAIRNYNTNGLPGTLLAIFIILYWIVPKSIDESLVNPIMEVSRFITLPLFAGIPLGISWHRLSSIAKGFIIGNVIPMIFVMSWLFLEAPVRICNNYLESQQEDLGRMLFTIGILLSLRYIWLGLVGKGTNNQTL